MVKLVVTKKDKIVLIENIKEDDYYFKNYIDHCKTNKIVLNTFSKEIPELYFNSLTNCEDGKFYKFNYVKEKNDIVCEL